jgi:hypothetical protein
MFGRSGRSEGDAGTGTILRPKRGVDVLPFRSGLPLGRARPDSPHLSEWGNGPWGMPAGGGARHGGRSRPERRRKNLEVSLFGAVRAPAALVAQQGADHAFRAEVALAVEASSPSRWIQDRGMAGRAPNPPLGRDPGRMTTGSLQRGSRAEVRGGGVQRLAMHRVRYLRARERRASGRGERIGPAGDTPRDFGFEGGDLGGHDRLRGEYRAPLPDLRREAVDRIQRQRGLQPDRLSLFMEGRSTGRRRGKGGRGDRPDQIYREVVGRRGPRPPEKVPGVRGDGNARLRLGRATERFSTPVPGRGAGRAGFKIRRMIGTPGSSQPGERGAGILFRRGDRGAPEKEGHDARGEGRAPHDDEQRRSYRGPGHAGIRRQGEAECEADRPGRRKEVSMRMVRPPAERIGRDVDRGRSVSCTHERRHRFEGRVG